MYRDIDPPRPQEQERPDISRGGRVGAAVARLPPAPAYRAGVVRDPVQWQDVGYRVDGPTSTEVTFDVTTRPGAAATCRVQALSSSYAQVGVLDVPVPPAETRTRRVTVTVPTVELAVTGIVQGCEPVD